MLTVWTHEPADWRVNFSADPSLKCRTGESGRLLTVGMGPRPTLISVREAAAKAVKTVCSLGASSALLDAAAPVEALGAEGLSAIFFGAMLARYSQPAWRKKEKPGPDFQAFVTGTGDLDAQAILAETSSLVQGVCLARDLINRPANLLTPQDLARITTEAAQARGMETLVLTREDCEKLGMGAFLAVGCSAAHAPCIIVLRYRGGEAGRAPIGLIGKGVCFDTGGYNLKGKASLLHQKGDMAGSATVFGALLALADNHVPVNVTAVLPAVENRISPDSCLPGDVLTSMDGTTIEIRSTDAEGRLILADAITWAIREEGVSHVVDVATLTGSMASMFGGVATGYLCNSEALNSALERAARRSGELFWRCPSFPEYRKLIESPVADLANSSDSCGAICAGLFLGTFAGDTPWLHLDIAGTSRTRTAPLREYDGTGATGVCVTTLYELCRELA